jgi:hypothetical protein
MPIVVEVRDYYAFAKATRRQVGERKGPDVDLWKR